MRIFAAAIVAMAIALMLFELMFFLIHSDAETLSSPELAIAINIQAAETKPEVTAQSQAQPLQEPLIQQMQVDAFAPTIAMADVNLKSPAISSDISLDFSDKDLGRYQKNWVQPSSFNSGSNSGQDYMGERDAGTKEMVPIATRQPLIPKVAWDNKINGWVLVAFTVKNNGLVEGVRVMDASPRGVFEAHAVSAVQRWRYDAYQGPEKYLSQRIEFLYKNYPNNWGDF